MYYLYKTRGYVLKEENCVKGLFDSFRPPTTQSKDWKHWIALLDIKTCLACKKQHVQIYPIKEILELELPLHDHCRCTVKLMESVLAGLATKDGDNGADYWVKLFRELPDYYIARDDAKKKGWKNYQGNLHEVAPGMMITGGVYQNRDGHLPNATGRTWREADINYDSGYRNQHRLLYSNDGLLFVTYDHYKTFYQVI